MKEFGSQIYAAIRAGRLSEPFGSDDVKRACPGWSDRTYVTFLSKHAVGNPSKTTELFLRVSPGLYCGLAQLKKIPRLSN